MGAAVSPLVGLLGNDAPAMSAVIVATLLLAVAVLGTVVRPWQLPEHQLVPAATGASEASRAG